MSTLGESQSPFADQPKKANGLSRYLIGGLVVLITFICIVSYYVIVFHGRSELSKLAHRSQIQLGQNITLALGQKLGEIKGIAQSMGSVATHLPADPSLFQNTFPSILNQLGPESLIAGGGIWPEEYAFDPQRKRNSYFWGRRADGELEFYDQYNNPHGDGYHHEEWYVPTKLLPKNQVYWSRSYTDPYSLQPMVTCSAPMYSEQSFKGVATVDLKLDGVSDLLDGFVDENSYAFIVDRNNKFISFPYPNVVLTHREQGAKNTPDFMYLAELAEREQLFSSMVQSIDGAEYQQTFEVSDPLSSNDIFAKELASSSYKINEGEAGQISSHLWQLQYYDSEFPINKASFTLDEDLIFGESVSVIVFLMPTTNWKVVTVFRKSFFDNISHSISNVLITFILAAVILFGVIAYFALKRGVLNRLQGMTEQLQRVVENGSPDKLTLEYNEADEIGALVYWYNQRSLQMEQALQVAEKANQDKAEFLSKMSYEFRTPLNSIIGFSRRLLLKLDGQVEPRFLSALQSIYRSALQQLDLVNGIMDHSSIESESVKLTLARESINEIVDGVEARLKDFIGLQDVSVKLERLSEDTNIYCDKIKIRQVLNKLISNAVKATKSGDVVVRVELCSLAGRPAVAFVVKDNGVGIPVEEQARLFQPFVQLEDRACIPGSGLGLFLSRYYVSLHSGDIRLQSNPEVEPGCTFTIVLPLSGPKSSS